MLVSLRTLVSGREKDITPGVKGRPKVVSGAAMGLCKKALRTVREGWESWVSFAPWIFTNSTTVNKTITELRLSARAPQLTGRNSLPTDWWAVTLPDMVVFT
jgi:hypothetical protein